MENYSLSLVGFDLGDEHLTSLNIQNLEIMKKGDVWRKRTGEKYKENIIKMTLKTTYEQGFEPVVDRMIEMVKSNTSFSELLTNCKYVELQVSVSIDDEIRIPHIHFTSKQMDFWAKIRADIDIHIS